MQFENRKQEHIRLALDPLNQASLGTDLERVHLIHDALPELSIADVRTESSCFGLQLKVPFFVAGMTAGHRDAHPINLKIAQAAARRGWAMGLGSQRGELEARGDVVENLDRWEEIREAAPHSVFFGNIGISQLIGSSPDRVRKLVDSSGAKAMFVHLNALQEAVQPEGTPHFSGATEAIGRLVTELNVPVGLKETGCGFSERTLEKISKLGLAVVDVSGRGGTHWGRIEGKRSAKDSLFAETADAFENWGESTLESALAAVRVFGQKAGQASRNTKTSVWGSGGVRTGLDAARLLAIGCELVGFAQPVLKAALEGEQELDRWMAAREYELRVALFCTGSRDVKELRQEKRWVLTEKIR